MFSIPDELLINGNENNTQRVKGLKRRSQEEYDRSCKPKIRWQKQVLPALFERPDSEGHKTPRLLNGSGDSKNFMDYYLICFLLWLLARQQSTVLSAVPANQVCHH